MSPFSLRQNKPCEGRRKKGDLVQFFRRYLEQKSDLFSKVMWRFNKPLYIRIPKNNQYNCGKYPSIFVHCSRGGW